jgi:hypothetical protein
MRDRHRREILNRLRHHKNEDANAVKTRIMTFWSIASRLFMRGSKRARRLELAAYWFTISDAALREIFPALAYREKWR